MLPRFDWMPDSRGVTPAVAPLGVQQLLIADRQSETRQAIISGTEAISNPAVSPEGKHCLSSEGISTAIADVDWVTAALNPRIARDRTQVMPAWAAKAPVVAYVSDRNGPAEVWLPTSDGMLLVAGSAESWLVGPAP